MRDNGCDTMDAGVPTDAGFVWNATDSFLATTPSHCNMTNHMLATLLVDMLNGATVPDKIAAAIMLTQAGYRAADILENINDVMVGLDRHRANVATLRSMEASQ